jgi:hypothetical protein
MEDRTHQRNLIGGRMQRFGARRARMLAGEWAGDRVAYFFLAIAGLPFLVLTPLAAMSTILPSLLTKQDVPV